MLSSCVNLIITIHLTYTFVNTYMLLYTIIHNIFIPVHYSLHENHFSLHSHTLTTHSISHNVGNLLISREYMHNNKMMYVQGGNKIETRSKYRGKILKIQLFSLCGIQHVENLISLKKKKCLLSHANFFFLISCSLRLVISTEL